MEKQNFTPTLGLFSTTSIIVGTVIGASIFVLPGQIAAENGPGVWVAFVVAAILAAFTAVVAAFISGLLPVSGASALFVRKSFGELVSLVYALCYVAALSIGMAAILYVMGFYIQALIPSLSLTVIMLASLVFCCAVNIFGNRTLASLQNITVAGLVAILIIFTVGAFTDFDPANYSVMFPKGLFPVLAASVPLYYAYAGFACIMDIGGEIKDVRKTLPKAMFISVVIVFVLYTGMSLAMTGAVNYTELGVDAPAFLVAQRAISEGFSIVLTVGCILGSYTSLVAMIQMASRLIYISADAKYLPAVFLKQNKRQVPYVSVILITILVFVALMTAQTIMAYAGIIVIISMSFLLLYGIGMLKSKKTFPLESESSKFNLSGFWFYFWPIGLILISIAFVGMTIFSDLKVFGIGVGIVVLIALLCLPLVKNAQKKRQNVES